MYVSVVLFLFVRAAQGRRAATRAAVTVSLLLGVYVTVLLSLGDNFFY